MEWSREAEIFIFFMYIVVPTLVIVAVFTALIILLRNLIRDKNKKKEK